MASPAEQDLIDLSTEIRDNLILIQQQTQVTSDCSILIDAKLNELQIQQASFSAWQDIYSQFILFFVGAILCIAAYRLGRSGL